MIKNTRAKFAGQTITMLLVLKIQLFFSRHFQKKKKPKTKTKNKIGDFFFFLGSQDCDKSRDS